MRKLDTSGISTSETGTIFFDGPDAVHVFRCIAIESAAALYLRTGIKANRAYTPTAMRNAMNEDSGSKAKNLKQSLHDHVLWLEAATGKPVTSQMVLEAAGLERIVLEEGK